MLRKLDLYRNPYLGVFCRVNERLLAAPVNSHEPTIAKIADALKVEALPFSIGSSTLIGSLLCMNSNGALISNLASKVECDKLGSRMNTAILKHRLNAVGNNILANDFGAVVNPEYDDDCIGLIGRALGVPAVRGTVANHNIVGAVALATNKGVLCHPHASDAEMKIINDTLQVPVSIGTANYGVPVIGACMLANSKGAVVGTPTTTVEIGRIEEAFVLY